MATDSRTLPPTNGNPSKTLGSTSPPPSEKSDPVEATTTLEGAPKTKAVTAAPVCDAEKKMRRAERFGITVQLSEQEKRNSRAERFGTVSSPQGSEVSKQSEELKRKARAERFGISAPTDDDAKKKARLERFAPASKADGLEEDKRRARAIRFSQAPVSSLSTNGKESIEPKAALAGKADGGS